MIAGTFHQGSGLGDQLHRYITVRTLAEQKGYMWGMLGAENFKGNFFLEFDFGVQGRVPAVRKLIFASQWNEKRTENENGVDIRSYDPEINFVEDNTIIDGCFEDDKYWGHNLHNIGEWLRVESLEMDDNICVIGFRGGEYATVPDLFLPKAYWDKACEMMRQKYPGIQFEVHTDDPETAKKFFPIYPIIQDIGRNWRSVRYAKHLIIANSAFYILPSLLNEDVKEVIAPRYWARHNIKTWARPACYYPKFTYIHGEDSN